METLIKFRLLADQLNESEFKRFISQFLIEHMGKNCILNLLFEYFKKNDIDTKPITNHMSEIIKSRKETSSTCKSKPIIIDKLPTNLIGCVASFLEMNSYINFEKTNRTIYIGCNSPNKLEEFPQSTMMKYPCTGNMNKYKYIKKLAINIKYFNNKLSFKNQTIWRDKNLINQLILSNENGDEKDVDVFIENNYINYNKIKKFAFNTFSNQNTFSFYNLLSRLTNIEVLYFYKVYLTQHNNYKDEVIRKWFPKLKGFGCYDGTTSTIQLSKQIIHIFGHQLEALEIPRDISNINTNIKFPQLKELIISSTQKDSKHSLNSTSSLKLVYIINVDANDTKFSVKEALKTQHRLQYLHIQLKHDQLIPMMEHLEYCLHETSDMSKDKMFIEFIVDNGWTKAMMKKIKIMLVRIMSILQISNIKHFTFELSIKKTNFDKKEMEKLIKSLDPLTSIYTVQIYEQTSTNYNVFVICNKGLSPIIIPKYIIPLEIASEL